MQAKYLTLEVYICKKMMGKKPKSIDIKILFNPNENISYLESRNKS